MQPRNMQKSGKYKLIYTIHLYSLEIYRERKFVFTFFSPEYKNIEESINNRFSP